MPIFSVLIWLIPSTPYLLSQVILRNFWKNFIASSNSNGAKSIVIIQPVPQLFKNLSNTEKQTTNHRDYRKEYLRDHASPEAKANRVKRNYWNRKIKTPPGKELDHKVPLSKGGSNSRSNIRVASVTENRSKGTKVAGYAHLYNQVDRHALNAYMAAKRREAALSYAKSEQERMDGSRRRVSNINLRRLRKYRRE